MNTPENLKGWKRLSLSENDIFILCPICQHRLEILKFDIPTTSKNRKTMFVDAICWDCKDRETKKIGRYRHFYFRPKQNDQARGFEKMRIPEL